MDAEATRKLEDKTEKYWRQYFKNDSERYIYYIRKLLHRELMAARDDGRLPEAEEVDLLVIMLGFSFEPLLQSIAVYRPKRLLVVHNREYRGRDDDCTAGREMLRRFVDLLPPSANT